MSKKLLYLFGEPGTGKITVARILQKRLGWRLFWVHDLDPVCAIVGRYPLPRLMDRISAAVLEELMDAGEDIVYVRPSRDRESVARVLDLCKAADYESYTVRLWARKSVLVERVSSRESSTFRVSDVDGLDRYLGEREPTSGSLASVTLDTGRRTPEQVADEIQRYIRRSDGKRDNRVPGRAGGAAASKADCLSA